MANKVVIFVSPYIGEVDSQGNSILDTVNLQHCKDLGVPVEVQIEKNFPNLPESMMFLKEKMIKIQEILNE
tara:strand:+ start:67 stop:279 length:213 start_codon:yes stop_codon:yes gene_type:complete